MGALTSRFLSWNKPVLRPTKWSFGMTLLLCAPLAVAQNNLGELLDAGAKKLSAQEFRDEVVQRAIVGPTPTGGGNLELMYMLSGMVQGTGSYGARPNAIAPISGDWTIDENGRICTSMRIGGWGGGGSGVSLPARCQVWFKYADQYFLSDSDTDRSVRVLRRTIKK